MRDNGIGIDAELLPNVFDLFEQGERTLDRTQGGLGVGLTLVQRLVELHHGRVEATSEAPGQGARVSPGCLASPSEAGIERRPADDWRAAATAECSAACWWSTTARRRRSGRGLPRTGGT